MRHVDTDMAGGTCPECGHNPKRARITVQDALPVVIDFLKLTSVSEVLSDNAELGLAMEDMLNQSLVRIHQNMTPATQEGE